MDVFATFTLVVLIFVGLGIGFAGLYLWARSLERRQGETMRRLGNELGLVYQEGVVESKFSNSALLGRNNAHITHSLQPNGGKIMVGRAYFTKGGNTAVANETAIMFDFIAVDIAKDSGVNLLIDSHRNNVIGRSILDTANVKQGMEKITLEGNFPDNYEVYETPGNQIHTLQVLNPKAMEELIQSFLNYDIELSGSLVYLYSLASSKSFTSATDITKRIEDGKRMQQFMLDHLPRV